MPYKVVIQGQKELIITDVERDILLPIWQEKSMPIVTIGKTTIAVNSIRGIFDISQPKNVANDEEWRKNQNEWDVMCKQQSDMDLDLKVSRELEIRILPIYAKMMKKPLSEYESLYREMKAGIADFFQANPRWPRCPAWVWWPFLDPTLRLRSPFTRYFDYIRRNDDEIAKWCKFHEISLNTAYQKALLASKQEALIPTPAQDKPSWGNTEAPAESAPQPGKPL